MKKSSPNRRSFIRKLAVGSAAPVCNNSYLENKFINWDPKNLNVKS